MLVFSIAAFIPFVPSPLLQNQTKIQTVKREIQGDVAMTRRDTKTETDAYFPHASTRCLLQRDIPRQRQTDTPPFFIPIS